MPEPSLSRTVMGSHTVRMEVVAVSETFMPLATASRGDRLTKAASAAGFAMAGGVPETAPQPRSLPHMLTATISASWTWLRRLCFN